jgi:hypothetical protein
MGNEQPKEKTPVKKKSKLSKRDYSIVSKQTNLTQNEVVVLFDKFHAGNPNGKLDKDSFGKLYVSLRKEPVKNLNEILDFVFTGS